MIADDDAKKFEVKHKIH